ncbi:MAG: hypothetical protein PHF30_05100 [Bacilli bacterium]|nr:hypothetical protein [Bacilli bacterium]
MKYKVITYIRVEDDVEELFNSYKEAENSYNEDDNTIYIIEEVGE